MIPLRPSVTVKLSTSSRTLRSFISASQQRPYIRKSLYPHQQATPLHLTSPFTTTAATMTSIRKVVFSNYDATDLSNISVQTATIPNPSKNEVQCEVIYSSFTGADANMARGQYPMQKSAPMTPGYCFVGRVKKNGPNCSRHQPGTLVVAMTVYDSEAELINYPEKYLHPVPEGVDAQSACAIILDWYTAYGLVHRAAKVQKGQRVFVHGISGAVGFAVGTLARLQGATVYGTASQKNHAALKEHGFDGVYDYRNKEWIGAMKALGGVHAAFDPLGFESFDESYSILSSKESSILVGYGNNLATLGGGKPRSATGSIIKLLSKNLVLFCKKSSTFFYVTRDDKTMPADLAELFGLVKSGAVKIPIKAVFGLEDIKEAHKAWGKAPGVGNLLVRVKGE